MSSRVPQANPADPQPDPITSKIQANTTVIDRPETSEYEAREANWSRIVTDNTSSANPNGFTYEYRKVINAGEKLNPTDINNIRAIFTSAIGRFALVIQENQAAVVLAAVLIVHGVGVVLAHLDLEDILQTPRGGVLLDLLEVDEVLSETLAYKTFKMEKIDGVVMANEQASLTAATPLPAGQTTLDSLFRS